MHRNPHTQLRRISAAITLLLLLVSLFSSMALASTDDTQQPIHIEADQAEISEQQGVMTYTGHVLLRQGDIELRADTVVVYTKEGELQRITAQGQPVHYRQQRENEAEIKGVSQRMEYRAKDKRLLLLGQAEFWQGENRFSGNRIQYDPETERVIANAGEADSTDTEADGSPSTKPQRVTVTLQPKKKTEKDAPRP
jgi:lipopolysaccharide export system protein LptA